jgi:hypothetical protein
MSFVLSLLVQCMSYVLSIVVSVYVNHKIAWLEAPHLIDIIPEEAYTLLSIGSQ